MRVNTNVIKALMRLRGFTSKNLSQLAGVRLENLHAWLDANDGSDLYISNSNQAEILRVLGIANEGLRTDCIHHWKIQEKYFSTEAYRDLQIMLHAFGTESPVLAVVFQQNKEPSLNFSTRQVFGLRFEQACVLLEVSTPYLKGVYFNPDNFEGLSWAWDNFVTLLADSELDKLLDADMTPAEFDDYATGKDDAIKWSRLHLIAREYSITPDDVEDWMISKAKANQMSSSVAKQGAVTYKKVANGQSIEVNSGASHSSKENGPSVFMQTPSLKQKAPVTRLDDYRLIISDDVEKS